jgi:hypothetical protein
VTPIQRIERFARDGVKFCFHGLSDNVDIKDTKVVEGERARIKRYWYFCKDHERDGSFSITTIKPTP